MSSTVVWCENKYVYNNYIAGFWNTISSLALVVCGII